jgi:hypothetical protein
VSGRDIKHKANDETGHVGAGLATILGIAAGAALVIAFAADSDPAGIAGGVLTGLGIFAAVNAPHQWFKRVYPRLDKLDPQDSEAHPEKRFRIEY